MVLETGVVIVVVEVVVASLALVVVSFVSIAGSDGHGKATLHRSLERRVTLQYMSSSVSES